MHAMLYSEASWLSEPFVRLPELAERAKVPDSLRLLELVNEVRGS